MKTIKLRVGGFVRTPDGYGLGKLISVGGSKGRVLVRHSTVSAEERIYPLDTLERAFLSPQMRVYWFSSRASSWRAGRVTDYFLEDDGGLTYTVRFPNGDDRDIAEERLETRSLLPHQDPAEDLAEGWCETQFFYDRRLAALKTLVHARAGSWGLTGLTSASIELLPHQVEVVRRILADPIQRYLLADEVGMGKTIEAGCIIRQILLDHPTERVIVLAPPSLVRQWERELEEKFGIGEFPGRVTVRSFDNLWTLETSDSDTLVVDESHHLVGGAVAGDSGEMPGRYQRLAHLAHKCRRLFVLSATPVLGDEDATLRLLHLLDPQVHRLEDREAFRRKVINRQEYGRLLMALEPDSNPIVLRRVARMVMDTFPEDGIVAELAPRLMDREAPPDFDRGEVVRALKRHLAETYRLHQRLVRTRRKDLEGWELLPRSGEVQTVGDPSTAVEAIWTALEDWRDRSLLAARNHPDASTGENLERSFARRFLGFFEAMGQSIELLGAEIERQWQAVTAGHLPTFADEPLILASLRRAIAEDASANGRAALAARTVREALDNVRRPITGAPKVVAFVSASALARQVAAQAERLLGRDRVEMIVQGADPDDVERAVLRLRSSKQRMAVICDRIAEEGLNLHFADAVVHCDLPLAPARLEQRIGRVDRFGRRDGSIRHFLVLPNTESWSPWLAWNELLANGFRLFETSISDVQFLLGGVQDHLTLELYRQGAAGLTGATGWVQQELESERKRLDEQYALDHLAMVEEAGRQAFVSLEEGDAADHFEDLDRWLVHTMNLKRRPDPDVRNAFRLHWDKLTLMPRDPWEEVFRPSLDRPLTYQRPVAVSHRGVKLVRPGAQLVEALHQHLLWDDRGTSFATWRQDPRWDADLRGEWVGFRLTYVIEFNLDLMVKQLHPNVVPSGLPAIRRRADALFPPRIETVTLDGALRPVEDPEVLAILALPYDKDRGEDQHDYNLGNRREVLFQVIPPERLYEVTKQVRQRSEELVWNSPRSRQEVAQAVDRVRDEVMVRNQYLERRNEALYRLEGTRDPALAQEIALNWAIAEAVSTPRVRLDAIGLFIISSHPPEGSAT